MAPEVITAEQSNSSYDYKADVWSLGITTIEMAECTPPMFDMHPMRVLFMIPKSPAPTLKEPKKWSDNMHQFIAACLQKIPDIRPSAEQLLKHPFVEVNPRGPAIVIELIEKARLAKTVRRSSNAGFPDLDEDAGKISREKSEENDDDGVDGPVSDDDEEKEELKTGTMKVAVADSLLRPMAATKINDSLMPNLKAMPMGMSKASVVINDASQIPTMLRPSPSQSAKEPGPSVSELESLSRPQASVRAPASSSPIPAPVREGDMRKSNTSGSGGLALPSAAPAKQVTTIQFKAIRMCRLTKRILAAQYYGKVLLLGMEEGLFGLEMSADPTFQNPQPTSKMTALSTRRYEQIDILPDIGNVFVSKSGSSGALCIHDAKDTDYSKLARRFELETKAKKMKEVPDVEWYNVSHVRTDVYLAIKYQKSTVLLTKWAPQPLWKFMKVKEFTVDGNPTCADVTDGGKNSEGKLFIGLEKGGFRVADVASGQIETLTFPTEYGSPMKILSIGKGTGLIFLAFQNIGILTRVDSPKEELKRYQWRNPLTFSTLLRVSASFDPQQSDSSASVGQALKLKSDTLKQFQQTLVVCGAMNMVDIWSLDTGRIVHVFETKRDRIKRLGLLMVHQEDRLFLMADEEKDGQRCSSVLCISPS